MGKGMKGRRMTEKGSGDRMGVENGGNVENIIVVMRKLQKIALLSH